MPALRCLASGGTFSVAVTLHDNSSSPPSAAFQNGSNSQKSSPLNGSHNHSGNFITQQHSSEYMHGVEDVSVVVVVGVKGRICPESNINGLCARTWGSLVAVTSSPSSPSSGGGFNGSMYNQSNSPLSPIYGDTGGSPISPHRRVNPRFM